MVFKNCPFCDEVFNVEILKGHIGEIHLGLTKLADFANISDDKSLDKESECLLEFGKYIKF